MNSTSAESADSAETMTPSAPSVSPAPPAPPLPATPSAAAANEAIREFVAGRTVWSKESLAELDRLRSVWRRAVRTEMVKAA